MYGIQFIVLIWPYSSYINSAYQHYAFTPVIMTWHSRPIYYDFIYCIGLFTGRSGSEDNEDVSLCDVAAIRS